MGILIEVSVEWEDLDVFRFRKEEADFEDLPETVVFWTGLLEMLFDTETRLGGRQLEIAQSFCIVWPHSLVVILDKRRVLCYDTVPVIERFLNSTLLCSIQFNSVQERDVASKTVLPGFDTSLDWI
jgi:hypothetical protein